MLKKDNKKAHISDPLAGNEIQALQTACADQHRDRITRFGSLKHRSKLQENYLLTLVAQNADEPTDESIQAAKSVSKLSTCGNFLLFKNFYTIEQVKLAKLTVCNQHLLCPFCAAIRASKALQKYTERIDQVMRENKKLKPVLITLTVKNGEDLKERSDHLMKSFRKLLDRRRDWMKKGRGFNEFCKIDGALYSHEMTYNKETNEWHPHLHMFALLDKWIDQERLSEIWHEITGDSYIVDVRKVRKSKDLGISEAVAEVCKYALKFGDLTVEKTWEAFRALKGLRLTGSIGSLWGVKIPENMADEMPLDEMPYLEMLYKFVFGKKSYYHLVKTRHVDPEPQARLERLNEDEGAQERHDKSDIELVAQAVVYKRKKEYWQVGVFVRVRTKQRARRWDGYKDLLFYDRVQKWVDALQCFEYAISH